MQVDYFIVYYWWKYHWTELGPEEGPVQDQKKNPSPGSRQMNDDPMITM